MSSIRIYECEYCDSEYDSKEKLIEHKKTETCGDFECTFCNNSFRTLKILKKHVNNCTERPTYNCYGCTLKLYSNSDLIYHQARCKSALVKCHWITNTNRMCTFTGKYEGFCKKHYIDYLYYNPNGVKSVEVGEVDICSMVVKTKYIPTSINHMVNGDFYSLEYIYNKSTFIIKEHNIPTIVMENIETKDTIIFWENNETKKQKPGKLISRLYADYEYECENDALVVFNDGNRMCKKCFECRYNTTINSLIIRDQEVED